MQTKRAPLWNAERWPIVCILMLGVVAAWMPPFFAIVPHDYLEFLLPWYEHVRQAGVVGAFAHPFSNYTPPYLYLLAGSTLLGLPPLVAIKLLSTLGALWASFAIHNLVKAAGGRQPAEAALAALLLPTVLINVPILAQADMFWVAPCLLAIAAAYRAKSAEMVFWASVGFTFKAQAIFIAPFVVAMLISTRAPWWQWTIPLLVYAAAMLPAWLAGWPMLDLLTVYVRQEQYVPPNGVRFVSTASNWWALFAYLDYDRALHSFWLGFAAAAAGTMAYVRRFSSRPVDLLVAAGVSAIMLPLHLPGMHERFYEFGELAIFALAWTRRSAAAVLVALLIQAQLLLAYFGWIVREPRLPIAGAALVTMALWLLLRMVVVSAQRPQRRVARVHPPEQKD